MKTASRIHENGYQSGLAKALSRQQRKRRSRRWREANKAMAKTNVQKPHHAMAVFHLCNVVLFLLLWPPSLFGLLGLWVLVANNGIVLVLLLMSLWSPSLLGLWVVANRIVFVSLSFTVTMTQFEKLNVVALKNLTQLEREKFSIYVVPKQESSYIIVTGWKL